MKKDPFNGKIRQQYIGYMIFSIVLIGSVCFLLGVTFIVLFALSQNQPLGFLITFPIVSAFCFFLVLVYWVISPRIIRSYPKHQKIAHMLFKPFVFEDGTIRADDILAFVNGNKTISRKITPENVFVETAVYVYSIRIRKYMYENRKSFSTMQIATLAEAFIKSRKIEIFNALIQSANSSFEKELLQKAMNDFKTKKYVSDETTQYYLDNDPRNEQKPNVPFCEICPLPILLKKGDIVRYKDGRRIRHAVIGTIPDEKTFKDFSDQCYLAYRLDVDLEGDHFLFDAHIHLHFCDINKTTLSKLSEKEMSHLKKIMNVYSRSPIMMQGENQHERKN